MARNWHAKGGRFKRGEFGDLGLRAYKDQQDRQIQHLRDQNRQDQLYSKENLRQMEGSGAKEIEHNRMLQGLKNDVTNLAIQNTKIRGDREVDAIKGKAIEAEKQAKFWQNFSTTWSKQYADVAGGLWDIHTTQQMHKQMDIVKNHEGHQKSINNFAVLNDISSIDQVNAAHSVYTDKSLTPKEQAERLGHLVDLNLRMNHKTKLALAQKFLNDWPAQHEMLRALAEEKKIPFNEETISKFYYIRARSLLQQHGISHTSKAGQLLLKGIDEIESNKRTELFKQTTAKNHLKLQEDLKERNRGLVGKVKFAVANGEVSANGDYYNAYATDLNERVLHEGKMWKFGQNNQVIEPSLKTNIRDDFETIAETDIDAGVFKSEIQMYNHLLNAPVPGAKALRCLADGTLVYAEKDTWGGRHPKLKKELSLLWDAYEKKKHTASKDNLAAENANTVSHIIERSQLDPSHENYIDIKDQKTLNELSSQYSNLDDVQNLIGNFEAFNLSDKKNSIVTTQMVDLFKDSNIEHLHDYIQHLDGEEKVYWNKRLNQLRTLHRNGLNKSGLNDRATSYVDQIVKAESLEKLASNPHFSDMIKLVEQEILYQFDLVSDQKISDQEKLVAVDKAIREQMQLDKTGSGPRGLGIFRRKNTGGNTRFLATWTEDDKPTFSKEDIELKLKNPEDFNTLFSELSNTANEGKVNLKKDGSTIQKFLVDIDDADMALRAVSSGGKMPQNDVIDWIYKNQPKVDGAVLYSKRDIWNNVFKSMGINEKIPAGANEFNHYKIETSEINANSSKYNDENKDNIATYTELCKEGICEKGGQSKESKDVDARDIVYEQFYNTLEGFEFNKEAISKWTSTSKDKQYRWWERLYESGNERPSRNPFFPGAESFIP
tara:strand:+ start:1061 stop:3721 length:2661 start_codon:yes stop_codon:yes gene_type:complete